jgi:hypothetical protein
MGQYQVNYDNSLQECNQAREPWPWSPNTVLATELFLRASVLEAMAAGHGGFTPIKFWILITLRLRQLAE